MLSGLRFWGFGLGVLSSLGGFVWFLLDDLPMGVLLVGLWRLGFRTLGLRVWGSAGC